MRYGIFGVDGRIEQAVNDDTVIELPSGAIELTEAQWLGRFDLLLLDGALTQSPHVPNSTPIAPRSVTMRQARLALLQAGQLAAVSATIAAMPGAEGDAARITWDYSTAVERSNPLTSQIGVLLGMSESQMDDLFTLAASL